MATVTSGSPGLDRLRSSDLPWTDIRKFGADRTGVSNCKAAFAAAFAVGGRIYVPPGDYKMLDVAYFSAPIHLELAPTARILSSGSAFTDTFVFGAYAAIAGISIRGGQFINTATAPGAFRIGSGSSNVEIEGVYCTGFSSGGACIYATSVNGLRVKRNRFLSSYGAMLAFGDCVDVSFRDNFVSGMANNGVRISGSSGDFSIGVDISDNEFGPSTGNQSPISVTCIDAVKHKRVRISGNGVQGLGIPFADGGNADLISTFGVDGLVVANNKLSGAGDLFIAVEQVTKASITGNVGVGADMSGITVKESSHVSVTGNTLVDVGKDINAITNRATSPLCGVLVFNATDTVIIEGNVVSDVDGGAADYAVGVNKSSGTMTNILVGMNAHSGMTSGEIFVKAGESVTKATAAAYP